MSLSSLKRRRDAGALVAKYVHVHKANHWIWQTICLGLFQSFDSTRVFFFSYPELDFSKERNGRKKIRCMTHEKCTALSEGEKPFGSLVVVLAVELLGNEQQKLQEQ